jgi:hypothetical protein
MIQNSDAKWTYQHPSGIATWPNILFDVVVQVFKMDKCFWMIKMIKSVARNIRIGHFVFMYFSFLCLLFISELVYCNIN